MPPGANEHGATPVSGGTQEEPRDLLVDLTEAGHIDQREEERSVEDVIGGEMLRAVDQREDHRDDHHLEERCQDPREARPLAAIGVHVRAREEQRGDEIGEGHESATLVKGLRDEPGLSVDHVLQQERGEDGKEHAREVERHQHDDARKAPGGLPAQQERKQRRTLCAHVALAQCDRLRRRQRRYDGGLVRDRIRNRANRLAGTRHLALSNVPLCQMLRRTAT
jgi:hypothetical protein